MLGSGTGKSGSFQHGQRWISKPGILLLSAQVSDIRMSPADSGETVCPAAFSLGTLGLHTLWSHLHTVFWHRGKEAVLGVTLTLLMCAGKPEAGQSDPLTRDRFCSEAAWDHVCSKGETPTWLQVSPPPFTAWGEGLGHIHSPLKATGSWTVTWGWCLRYSGVARRMGLAER